MERALPEGEVDGRVSRFAVFTLVMAPVVALALVLSFTRSSFKQVALDPTAFWGGPLPQSLSVINVFETKSGLIGEFELPDVAAELRVLITKHEYPKVTPALLSSLQRGAQEGVPPFFAKYTKAVFNPRRGGPTKEVALNLHGNSYPLEQMEGLKRWYYTGGILVGTNEVIQILSIKKGEQVSLSQLGSILSKSPRISSALGFDENHQHGPLKLGA